MDALTEKLDAELREWGRDTAAQVRERVVQDVLDVTCSRAVEQQVLDLLDESTVR